MLNDLVELCSPKELSELALGRINNKKEMLEKALDGILMVNIYFVIQIGS